MRSQCTYVGLNSSVSQCLIDSFSSGMTCYYHSFEEYIESKNIIHVHFLNEGSFSHLFDRFNRIEPNFIGLC